MSHTRAHLSNLRTALTVAGADWPKPIAAALADADRVAQQVTTLDGATAEQVGDAVVAAILDGRDPLDDEQVRRVATARALRGTGDGILEHLTAAATERRTLAAVADHADTIADTLCTAADAAGERLHAAHETLGDVDLKDAAAVLSRGPQASRAWTEATEAVTSLRHLDHGILALAQLTRSGSTAQSAGSTVRFADVTLAQRDKLGHKADPWDLVRAGATIALADLDEIRERVDALDLERQQRQDAHDGASRPLLVSKVKA
jgi:hypothetical protein